MTDYLGVIGGSNFIKSAYFSSGDFTKKVCATPYGRVQYYVNSKDGVIFIQRHAADPEVAYSPPHMINKKAIITALKNLGVSRILGFNSTGAMKRTIPLGSLVVPDDYLALTPITLFDDATGHVIPGFDKEFRTEIIKVLQDASLNPIINACYLQTTGPRFETEAEIRLFAPHCDIVGMTAGHEAVLCKELAIPYATVCMVDNMANGIVPEKLTTDAFHNGVAANLARMETLFQTLVAAFKPTSVSTQASDKEHVEQLIHAKWVVPVRPGQEEEALADHSLAIREGKIVAIVPTAEAKARFTADVVEDLSAEHVLMPGFVNAHTHCGMTMLRGYSDDLALLDWLRNDIWPAEARYMPENDQAAKNEWVSMGTKLAIAEMLRGGTTCFNDMYFVPGATAQVLRDTGFRGVVGFPILDFPSLEAAEAKIAEGLATLREYKDVANVSFAIAPHAPYTVGDANLAKCKQIAQELGILYHIHLHETAGEVKDSIAQDHSSPSCHLSNEAMAPLDNLNRMGLLDDKVIAVHMTCLTEQHLDLLAEKKVNIVHCPYSNLKLASGLCPVAELVKRGVNVAIGTDSTASNNSLDMFAEMKLAACLSKVVVSDPTAIPAHTALRMATYNGAKTIGLEDKIGSLETNKYADVVAVRLGQIEHVPMVSVVSQLVYSTNRSDVTDVWVGGKRMLCNKKVTCFDEQELKSQVAVWEQRINRDKAALKN